MEETPSIRMPVSSEVDAIRVAQFGWRLARRAGCDRDARVRFAIAALKVASAAAGAVQFTSVAHPESAIRISAIPADQGDQLLPVPAVVPLDGLQQASGANDLPIFAGEMVELALSAAENAAALEGARSMSAILESELEETNRGVLALYAELEDRADKLRRADELKSRFLSYASHELRTPLNGIIGLVRLLRDSKRTQSDPEERKQLAFIQQAAEEMREMVNDLLDLAKVEAGKVTVQPSEFGLEFVFGALRGIFRPLLQTEDVVLRFEDTSAVPAIYSDEAKVSQILRNLISNALKFTEHGEVRVWATAQENLVNISVQDTGIGIAPENLGRIFEEYTQIEHPLQRRTRGTGLGLPLCRRLAELLGGRVEVESELGRGSTFTLILPQHYETGATLPGASRLTSIPHTTPTLLVIDDAEIDRYLLKQLLTTGGEYRIVEAEDGKAGLEAARLHRPDMIFLDLSLPKVDGFRVLSELRDSAETRTIPVVIVTARNLSEAERAQLEGEALTIFDKAALAEARKLNVLLGPAARVTVEG